MTDDEVAEWNEALKNGDEALVTRLRDQLLRRIHTKILDEDVRAHEAGWKPTT